MATERQKDEMERLINRWFELDRWDIPYEELVENEKEKLEIWMWDLLQWAEYDQELEDMIPSPISWK